MTGTNQINRRRLNFQKTVRARKAKAKRSRGITKQTAVTKNIDLIVNKHQKKMLISNPHANIDLSGKKKRKLMKTLKHEESRLIASGLAVKEIDMEEIQDEDDSCRVQDQMDLTSSGTGTTLGGPKS